MMLKLVVARGINSAFLLYIVTSDTEQLDADTIQQVAQPTEEKAPSFSLQSLTLSFFFTARKQYQKLSSSTFPPQVGAVLGGL